MKFENVRAAVNAHYDDEITRRFESLETITCADVLASWWYRKMMTPAALEMVKACDPADLLPEEAKKKIQNRIRRECDRDRARQLQKVEAAENAPDLEELRVLVEWKRSRVWGMNPTATATVDYDHSRSTTGHASGCGYDKRSAAIADALNDQPSVMKILYTHAEEGKKFLYSVNVFAGVPSFDGGCGVSCFRSVFEACGYVWSNLASNDTAELYGMRKA